MAFVLCGPRSGSTLLRFVIGAHPEIACPPESLLPDPYARVWSTNSSGSSPGPLTLGTETDFLNGTTTVPEAGDMFQNINGQGVGPARPGTGLATGFTYTGPATPAAGASLAPDSSTSTSVDSQTLEMINSLLNIQPNQTPAPTGDTTPAILPDGITPWPLPSAVPSAIQRSEARTS
jgi:hypothetical protein